MDTQNETDISRSTAAKIFWIFVIAHALFWTVLPTCIQLNPGNIDVSEMVATAREWPMGTTKHPAAPFWFFEALYQATGRAEFSLYLIGQLWTVLGLWAVWRLSREIVSEKLALISVLCTAAFRYYNMGVISYTTSVPPIALWAAATTLFYLSLKYNRLKYWFGTGVCLGLGVLSKYSVFALVLTMVLFLTVSRQNRRYWRTAGPYLTTFAAFLLFLPHLIWSYNHGFPAVVYGIESVTQHVSLIKHFTRPIEWFFKQIILILPILIGLIPIVGFLWQLRLKPNSEQATISVDTAAFQDKFSNKDNWLFLSFIIFFPVVFQIVLNMISGGTMRTAYGSPLWSFIALWFLCGCKTADSAKAYKTAVGFCIAVLLGNAVCYVMDYQLYYWHQQRFGQEICGSRIHYPGRGLADLATKTWAENGSDGKCPYITGDWLPACHAAMYMADRPCTLIYYYGSEVGLEPTGFWASDADVNEKGGIVIWNVPKDENDGFVPDWLYERYPNAKPCSKTFELPYQTKADVPSLRVGCAVVTSQSTSLSAGSR